MSIGIGLRLHGDTVSPPMTKMVSTNTITACQLLSENLMRPFMNLPVLPLRCRALGRRLFQERRNHFGAFAQCMRGLEDHLVLGAQTLQNFDAQTVVDAQLDRGQVNVAVANNANRALALVRSAE